MRVLASCSYRSQSMSIFKNYRQNFVNLSDIFGVNLKKGIVTPHPDFVNNKETIREEVMEALSAASDPSTLPPIELYLGDDGLVHVVDGYHRLEHAMRQYKTDPEKWGRIKYERFSGTREEAMFKALTSALGDSRSSLTDAEQFKSLSRWIHAGMDAETLCEKMGRKNSRWINKVRDIMSQGIPALETAVASGEIDVNTAVQIARKVEPTEQKDILKTAIEESKGKAVSGSTNTNQSKLRSQLGLSARARKVRSFEDIRDFILAIWDADASRMWESGELGENLDGQLTGIIYCLGMDEMKQADVAEIFDEWFWKKQEKEKEVIAKQSGKGKKTTAAPWQVKAGASA